MPHPIKGASSPKVKIRVTQQMIATACRRDSSHCMIADALQARLPNARYISVDLATIRFSDLIAGKRYVYLTPRGAQEALLKFDQGEKVEPFELTVEHAHVLPTGSGNRARLELRADPKGSPHVPIRVGGDAPPIGPLPGGAPTNRRDRRASNNGGGAGNKTGRRREFGLRAIIR